jgi:WD40 repeat protein
MLGNRTERPDATGVFWADVSPDGRLVATCDRDGVRLWEADTGRELAHLKAGYCDTVLFHPNGQSLISSGRWGLYHWAIRPDPDHGPDAVCVGPPQLVRETAGGWPKGCWLPDHRTLALIDNANARVLLVDSSHPHPAWSHAPALDAGENHRMTTVAVSPDGRWLAVGGWFEAGVRGWDLHRRRLERILRPKDAVSQTLFFSGFSPDGRWLISCTQSDAGKRSYHFWRVGTWDLDRQIDHERDGIAAHPPAFTNDGRLMALGIAPDQVLLAEAATGRELARLTTLQPVTPEPLAFSPDGTKLIARTNQKTALVWDLRQIRDQLAPMGLDWDAPPYPAASAASEASGPVPPPRPVRVIGEVIETQARRAAEMVEMNLRLAANPDDADALIHRG